MTKKTALTFYCDDTCSYTPGPGAFKTFLEYVKGEGIMGEASALLGHRYDEFGLLSRPETDLQKEFAAMIPLAYEAGIDTHMEILTHNGVYDFKTDTLHPDAQHEGVWLHEPEVSTETFKAYFGNIIKEGEKIGVKFTGLTWPGCGCEPCTARYAELKEQGITDVNQNVFDALLELAEEGKFRGPTIPCFINVTVDEAEAICKARKGEYGVFELIPNAVDKFGIWENNPDLVDPDYYITEDGSQGRIVEVIQNGANYCLFYAHWQGLNPALGKGWNAFKTVTTRIRKHLDDHVEWMRPSDYTNRIINSM